MERCQAGDIDGRRCIRFTPVRRVMSECATARAATKNSRVARGCRSHLSGSISISEVPCCHPDNGHHPVEQAKAPLNVPNRFQERPTVEHLHRNRYGFDLAAYSLGYATHPFFVDVGDGDIGARLASSFTVA
jgi:hypothetical protein